MEKQSKFMKISLAMNILIAALTIMTAVFMFTGFKFMSEETLLESTKLGMFKFFTVDSNLFMGIVAMVFAINQILVLKGKKKGISKTLYIVKPMATSAVALTFVVVFGYLGFFVPGGIVALLKNSNLFFHLIIPVLSILTFVLFERCNLLKFKDAIWGVLPAALYSIFYITNVFLHIEDGKVAIAYDFYMFVQGGLWQAAIVLPLMFGLTYGLSILLWLGNRRK